jgi:hypothetical protein
MQNNPFFFFFDSTRFNASGLAAAVGLRNLCGFGFPPFANELFKKLGYGWGNSLLGLLQLCSVSRRRSFSGNTARHFERGAGMLLVD